MADDPLDPICAALVDVVRDVTPDRARTMAEGTAATWKLTPMELRQLLDELIGDGTDLRLSPAGIMVTLTTMLGMSTKPRGRELLRTALEAGERFARGEKVRPQ